MPQWQNKFATNHCTKEQQDLSRNSGMAPIQRPFVLETPPSPCHVQYLIGILTLQITQHLLLGCASETLCSLHAEFKGLFADTQGSRMPLCTRLLALCGDKTSAGRYEKLSHPHILPKYSTDGKLWTAEGECGKLTKPWSFASFISNWRPRSAHLFWLGLVYIFWLDDSSFSWLRAKVCAEV